MAEDPTDVMRDADRDCAVCRGEGWHWGWDRVGNPVRLRCVCVDANRMARKKKTLDAVIEERTDISRLDE